MKIRACSLTAVPLLAVALAGASIAETEASERDRRFFKSVEGEWSGPGEIVAGKYKGTRFVCTFTGTTPSGSVGMSLDGGCRVGFFTQKMSATVKLGGRGYGGSFMDGAGGEGLDIVSGNVTSKKAVFSLNRKSLDGAMLARMADEETMNVTVSVKVNSEMVPVIGMSLKRKDTRTVGSINAR